MFFFPPLLVLNFQIHDVKSEGRLWEARVWGSLPEVGLLTFKLLLSLQQPPVLQELGEWEGITSLEISQVKVPKRISVGLHLERGKVE